MHPVENSYLSSFLELDDEIVDKLNQSGVFTIKQLISRRYVDIINDEKLRLAYPQLRALHSFISDLGLQFKPETRLYWFLKSLRFAESDFWKKSINRYSIFNVLFVIENSQGDIDFIFVVCIFGFSLKINIPYFGAKWKNFRGPYICYWKFIGYKDDDKYGIKSLWQL